MPRFRKACRCSPHKSARSAMPSPEKETPRASWTMWRVRSRPQNGGMDLRSGRDGGKEQERPQATNEEKADLRCRGRRARRVFVDAEVRRRVRALGWPTRDRRSFSPRERLFVSIPDELGLLHECDSRASDESRGVDSLAEWRVPIQL